MYYRIGFVGCSGLQSKRWNMDSNFFADLCIVRTLLSAGNFVYWIGFEETLGMIPDYIKSNCNFGFIPLQFQLEPKPELKDQYPDLNSNYDEFKLIDRLSSLFASDWFQENIELDFLIKDYQKTLFVPHFKLKDRNYFTFPVVNIVHLTQSFIMKQCSWESFSDQEMMQAAIYDCSEYVGAAANIFASQHNLDISLSLISEYVKESVVEEIRKKCFVIPFPFYNLSTFSGIRNSRSYANKDEVIINFPHRLNSDRNPALLLSTVRKILEEEPDLKLKVVLCKGDNMRVKQSFRVDYEWLKAKGVVFNKSEFLSETKSNFADSGAMLTDYAQYLKVLSMSDISVCMSPVESFGISFRESTLCGVYPLLNANGVVYKEFTDCEYFLFDKDFKTSLRNLIYMVQLANQKLLPELNNICENQELLLEPGFVGDKYSKLFDFLKKTEIFDLNKDKINKGKVSQMVDILKKSGSVTKADFITKHGLSWVNKNDFYGLKNKMYALGVKDDLSSKFATYSCVTH